MPAAQWKRFDLTVTSGAKLTVAGLGYETAGVIIDNASGAWIYVGGLQRYIAPYTLGYAANFYPTSAGFTLFAVDGPVSGALPSTYVGVVTVNAFSVPVGESVGTAYDLQNNIYNILTQLGILDTAIRTAYMEVSDPVELITDTAPLANRKAIQVQVQNNTSDTLWVGENRADLAGTGIEIVSGATWSAPLGPNNHLYGASTGLCYVNIMELS